MAEIIYRVYDVALEMDNDISVPYNPSRKINTTLTGRRVFIHYRQGVEKSWSLRLSGKYPLDTPKTVCTCCAGVVKTHQGATQTYGYPYRQNEADVPAWVYRLVGKYAPEWFVI